jgi:hypothetical protein
MKNKQNCGSLRETSPEVLQFEIEFWREMIATSKTLQTQESLERMRQALSLAETKLLYLSPDAINCILPNAKKPGTKTH